MTPIRATLPGHDSEAANTICIPGPPKVRTVSGQLVGRHFCSLYYLFAPGRDFEIAYSVLPYCYIKAAKVIYAQRWQEDRQCL